MFKRANDSFLAIDLAPEWELFDLQKDPWEIHNLYNHPDYKSVRLELAEDFLKFYSRTEKQTNATSLSRGGGGGEMAPGPTRDLWWNRMDWKTVKEKYHL